MQFTEGFKTNSPMCVPVALLFYDRWNAAVIRHTGLQLLEHTVKQVVLLNIQKNDIPFNYWAFKGN